MSTDDDMEKMKEAAVLKLRDYLRSKGFDARMEVLYGFTTRFTLDVYGITMKQWKAIKQDEAIISALKDGTLHYVAGYTKIPKKGSVLKHLHVFSSSDLKLEIPSDVVKLRDRFKAKGFHVKVFRGYDLQDRPFYNLAFSGLTHKQHEALEKDPDLNAAVGPIISGVAFFEKGWTHDITKISVWAPSFDPEDIKAGRYKLFGDDSFDPEEVRQIKQSLEDIKAGRYKDYDDVEDLIRDLHSESESGKESANEKKANDTKQTNERMND